MSAPLLKVRHSVEALELMDKHTMKWHPTHVWGAKVDKKPNTV